MQFLVELLSIEKLENLTKWSETGTSSSSRFRDIKFKKVSSFISVSKQLKTFTIYLKD